LINSITLERVTYIPKELAAGRLYVSTQYSVAAHLCACGCGSKVVTPLNPAGWAFSEQRGRPSLRPSIGNWQLPCRSHYVISNGAIHWAGEWPEARIVAGRAAEQARRETYYASLDRERGFWGRLRRWLSRFFGE
jgi:uncharacterized protein DUF6527